MSKSLVSAGNASRKGKDGTKSSGNIVLNVTDIVVNTINNDNNNTDTGKVKKNKREKINIGNIGNNSKEEPSVGAETADVEELVVHANKKIDNTLAVALTPSVIPYIETPWTIIGAYFRNQHLKRLVRHQIESYNDFVNNQIQRTIDMFNPVLIASEQDMCRRTKKNKLELHVTFDKFNLYRPQIHENNGATKIMFPHDARSRNFTYASTMTIDINIRYVVRSGENLENAQTFYKSIPKVHIGKLPIMLKSSICVLSQYTHINNNVSGECKHDAGGYFIINGSEKTVLGQERAAENRVYCFNTSKNNNKWSWTAEIKSVPDFKCISPKQINVMVANKNNGFGCPIYVQIPRIKQPIALFVVFRALGVMSDKEICKHIVLDIDDETTKPILDSLQASIIDANTVMTQEDALKIITSNVMYTPMNMDKEAGAAKKRTFTQDVLGNDLFPHCHNSIQKIYFLGYMVNRVLRCSLDMAKQDDRDSYVNKRVDLTGALLNNLFRNYFNKLVKDMSKQIIKEINTGSWRSTDDHMSIVNKTNIYKIIKSTTIENGIKRALSTGDFGIKNVNSNKVGVAQVLNRLTYVSSLSHLRRINTPVDKSGKLIAPRKLHNTTWGFLCVAETPEGGSVGVVKNISYMTHLTIPSSSESLHQHVEPFISRMDNLTPKDMFVNIKVFVNGAWLGNTSSPIELYNAFKDKKSKGIINIYTSVVFDIKNKEIRICNDAGRITRPVLRVKNNKVFITDKIINELNAENLTWDDLLTDTKINEAVIEYIDPEEQNFSMIAMKPADLVKKENTNFIYKFTHCEIHPSTIFGILASCIPFPEHNQSPRNTYQCLDINETVLMSNGMRVPIKNVKIGDEVMTYHPTTFEVSKTKVVNHFIQENMHQVYKITTISGREIIATEDHKFSTNNGWKMVKDMIDNPELKVGVFDVTFDVWAIEFISIKSIIPVSNRLVSDIEVESENHSFIAGNGFASSNCAMGKQAMGMYVTNYQNRMDKTAYVLTYPSRPLVDTRVMGMIKLDQIPSGSAVIVAIMTYSGYNQEDSILVNKGSIDRGLFNATIYHTEKDEDKKINGDEEIRCKPDPSKTKGMKFGNYDKVNNKGLVPENTFIENRDIIIAKVVPIKENRNDHTKLIKYEDHSKIHRTTEESYIDKNFIDRNGDGYCIAKVRIRTSRKPVIGDKLSSRHGQKGTVGNIIPESDMPFTVNGMRPDIIINPHAIPSRMTIGQLKETLLGKVLVQLGLFGDGTSFGELAVDDIRKELLKVGYEAHGNEILYNGMTGEQIESHIFIGPAFYQRLKHMVNDKQHSRSIGPMVNLTRQPAEGRSRDGGLRFGEMERDCGCEDTPITLSNGLSVKIKSLGENNGCVNIMGWSKEKNGMIPSKQVAFMNKGTRECVQLTYEDGRKITFTEDHPVLTSDNTWVKIKDIELNSTKIKTSITCPLVDINEEIKECAGWTLQFGTRILETNTREEFMKTLAFARIIGYLITDGHVNSKIKIADLFLGHILDVESIMKDIELFCESKQKCFNSRNLYIVRIPAELKNDIVRLPGLISGKKVNQPGTLPNFILDEKCPRPIVREFLAGMFGGDGHTCVLSMHRGKRDILSSVSFSQTKTYEHRASLQKMFEDIQKLLAKCGVHNTTIQTPKETSFSKKKFEGKDKADNSERSFQLTLHVPIEQLVSFSEKIGFRYCCHKSQRLEAGVSYRRLREEVTRQHNWIVNRVNEITKFKEIKEKTPEKIVPTKKAIIDAVNELKKTEGLIHEYAIPSTHDITDHLIKGTEFGKFTAKGFPNAKEFLEKIGALDWFKSENETASCDADADAYADADIDVDADADADDTNTVEENINSEESTAGNYGVTRDCGSIPTMNLTVVSRIPVGPKQVYDISVEDTNSFLANGIVAHNCMVSHGAARFTRGRLYDASDKYQVHVCRDCGMIAAYNDKMGIHCCRTCDNRTNFAYVEIPYACKLLFQELQTMNIAPRIMT
jgi:DNA-directed RNA polymerase II subunit RPB2